MSAVGLFGRQYSEAGSTNSDFLIKTKGKVKILWGNKFIDLIKDGKIAVDGFQFNKVKDKESIKGQDGFYVTPEGSIYIKIGSEVINLYGEVDSTYVSFIEELEPTTDQLLVAQKNIGLVFLTFQEALSAGISNGFVYIIDDGKLYTVSNAQFQEFKTELPNPYSQKFVILIASGESCSLLIDGYYDTTRNCLVIGKEGSGLYLYSTEKTGYVQSLVDQLVLETSDGNQILIESDLVHIRPKLICDTIQSNGANVSEGYRLYLSGGESTLEVDNIVVRKGFLSAPITHLELLELIAEKSLVPGTYYLIYDFLNEWELTSSDLIDDWEVEEEDEASLTDGNIKNTRPLLVQAISNENINPNVIMVDNPLWEVKYDITYIDPVTILENTDNGRQTIELSAKGRITYLKDEFGNACNYDFKHLKFLIDGLWRYTFDKDGTDASMDGTAHDNEFNIVNYAIVSETASVRSEGIYVCFAGETHNNIIKSFYHSSVFGTFTNNYGVSLIDCQLPSDMSNVYFHGDFYQLAFDSTAHLELSSPNLFKDVYFTNDSVRIIDIPNLVFPGMIVMYSGDQEPPSGWAICNGENGTPDLTGHFIKASTTEGDTGSIKVGTLDDPEFTYYSLRFIMKL